MTTKDDIWERFLYAYLDNVKSKLPESYRAQQLKTGGMEAAAVVEFETQFLKSPFRAAVVELERETLAAAIKVVEAKEYELDKLNAELGSERCYCIYCESNVYTGAVGIVHTKTCPLNVLRDVLAKLKEMG